MRHYCTLFDANYLTRALVMYRSLVSTGDNFTLYAVCFDDLTVQILERMELPRFVLIPLDQFETPQLRTVKGSRSPGEYCWTCASHVIRHVLDTFRVPEVTYLDADLCFYRSPNAIFEEFSDSKASVLITPHCFSPRYQKALINGIYCVQFTTFKSDEYGIEALQWWQDRCVEWCFARFEDGKFGDQKYLDDWPVRFKGVHVLNHLGGGVAPWNIQQYKLKLEGGQIWVDGSPLIFYHFHNFRFFSNGKHDLSEYKLSDSAVDLLYRPYAAALRAAKEEIKAVCPSFDYGYSVQERSLRSLKRYVRRKLRGEYNVYSTL